MIFRILHQQNFLSDEIAASCEVMAKNMRAQPELATNRGHTSVSQAFWQPQRVTRAPTRTHAEPQEGSRVERLMPFNYVSSDGRRKASLQDAMSPNSKGILGQPQPWQMGFQMSERDLAWTPDFSEKLVQGIAVQEMNISKEEFDQKLSAVVAVLPGLVAKIGKIKPTMLAALVQDPVAIANKLVQLKAVLPGANIELLVLRDFQLLLETPAEEVAASIARLRELLPSDLDVDRLCEKYPSTLHVDSFAEALDEAKRLMPGMNVSVALTQNPEVIFSCQRHKAMIPYDPVP